MEARLTPKSLSGHEARFILERIRTMIATKNATMQAVSNLGHSLTPATSTLDDLAALEVIEEIITSSSDASACGIIAPCGAQNGTDPFEIRKSAHPFSLAGKVSRKRAV